MTLALPQYTTQLQAGLGLVDETKTLLDIWSPGMTPPQLQAASLASGRFTTVTARRLAEMAEKLEELKQSLIEVDVELDVKLNPNIHDREIRIDNGWIVKIGRGLDFYQKPNGWFEIGANDMSLRKCLETKVDIYRDVAG